MLSDLGRGGEKSFKHIQRQMELLYHQSRGSMGAKVKLKIRKTKNVLKDSWVPDIMSLFSHSFGQPRMRSNCRFSVLVPEKTSFLDHSVGFKVAEKVPVRSRICETLLRTGVRSC